MPLINWADVQQRYPDARNVEATLGNSVHIFYAEAELNSRLAVGFTTPFSSSNVTARDLCMDLIYGRLMKFSNPERAQKVLDNIDARCNDLLNGKQDMVLIDGTLVHSSAVANGVWSSNENYSPTFDMTDAQDQEIDPDRQQDEYDAR